MFDLSLAEILLIIVVALVFIGPKELPVVVRAVAKAMRGLKDLAGEIRAVFDDLAKESGVSDIQKELDAEVRMIQGDDGKWYESYDTNPVIPAKAGIQSDKKMDPRVGPEDDKNV